MKKKNLNTKLNLGKKIIIALNTADQERLYGGDSALTRSCIETCVNCVPSSARPGSCANTACISGQQTHANCPTQPACITEPPTWNCAKY